MTVQSRGNRGALWMLVAGLMFSAMGVCVKFGSRYFTPAELVFYRSLVGLLVVWGIILVRGYPLATPHWRQHLYRGVSGFGALALYFHTITVLPLATAVTLNYTSSLFIALITTVMLREAPPLRLLFAVLLGFAGVVALLNPAFHSDQLFDGLLGLVSGILAAIAMINVRGLGKIGEPEWRVVFYFSLLSTLVSGAWMLPRAFSPLTIPGVLLILGMGTAATLAQLALTRAYGRGRALVVASLAYSTVAFASLAGVLLWNDWLPASAWMGIAAIVLSGLICTQALPVAKPRRAGR